MTDEQMYLILIILPWLNLFIDKLFSFLQHKNDRDFFNFIKEIQSLKDERETQRLFMEQLQKEYYPHLFDKPRPPLERER